MSDRARRSRWLARIALTAVLLVAAEWTARRLAPPANQPPDCPVVASTPAPAIGDDPGANSVTRLYEPHPTLGWVPSARSPHFPRTERIPRGGEWIALFGDGSIAGPPDPSRRALPERLEEKLGVPVILYAVAGHGLDRIVSRAIETLRDVETPPRTAVLGVRVDAIERLATPPPHRPDWLPRLRLAELAREMRTREPAAAPQDACSPAIDRERLRSLLHELRTAAAERDVELVVSLHAPTVPQPRHGGELALLREELDALAIHRVDTWEPATEPGDTERRELAAARIEHRLASVADYVWGTRIEFGGGGTFERHRSSGFGPAVPRGRWTMQESARLEVSPPPGPGGILAEIEVVQAVTFDGDARALTLRVGEVAVARWPMSSLDRPLRDTFYIDEGLAAGRPLDLRFELSPLLTPAELDLWPDPRPFGVLVSSLSLRPEAAAP